MSRQWATLWALMAGQRLRYALAVAAMALATVFALLVPLVARATIDGAIAEAVTSNPAEGLSLDVAPLLGGRVYLAENLWLAALVMMALTGLAGGCNYLKGRWVSTGL